jgi:hypothetical protein
MIKIVTNDFVLKFVGGEPNTWRLCHYCRKERLGGMICVYSNQPKADGESDHAHFICPECAVKGCQESESQWQSLFRKQD